MMKTVFDFFSDARRALFFFAAVSAAALGTALVSQYIYGLAPCELCLWQRWPYVLVVALGVIALFLPKQSSAGGWLLGLTALIFFANAGIAFYHTGVERKWWPSLLEGCTTPPLEGNIADVLARIQATPPVRCDEIPWTDPVLGWSMANYNVIACLALGLIAAWAALRKKR